MGVREVELWRRRGDQSQGEGSAEDQGRLSQGHDPPEEGAGVVCGRRREGVGSR